MTLKHAIVQILSDDRAGEEEVSAVLEGQDCVLRRARPGRSIDITKPCDVGIIVVRRSCGWSAGLITALRSAETACAAVVVLGAGDVADVAQSLRGGAVDCLVRPVSRAVMLESLVNAIACTLRWRGRLLERAACSIVFGPERPSRAVPSGEPRIEEVVRRVAGQNQLTPREREVLYWLLQGHRYDDIATVLGVVPRTAKFHAANLLRKLELDSRYDLPRLLAGED